MPQIFTDDDSLSLQKFGALVGSAAPILANNVNEDELRKWLEKIGLQKNGLPLLDSQAFFDPKAGRREKASAWLSTVVLRHMKRNGSKSAWIPQGDEWAMAPDWIKRSNGGSAILAKLCLEPSERVEIESILDWMLSDDGPPPLSNWSKISYAQAKRAEQSWVSKVSSKRERDQALDEASAGEVFVMEVAGGAETELQGARWVRLDGWASRVREGEAMKNCIGKNKKHVLDGGYDFYSLRGNDAKPLLSLSVKDGAFEEVKAFANAAPPKNWRRAIALLVDVLEEGFNKDGALCRYLEDFSDLGFMPAREGLRAGRTWDRGWQKEWRLWTMGETTAAALLIDAKLFAQDGEVELAKMALQGLDWKGAAGNILFGLRDCFLAQGKEMFAALVDVAVAHSTKREVAEHFWCFWTCDLRCDKALRFDADYAQSLAENGLLEGFYKIEFPRQDGPSLFEIECVKWLEENLAMESKQGRLDLRQVVADAFMARCYKGGMLAWPFLPLGDKSDLAVFAAKCHEADLMDQILSGCDLVANGPSLFVSFIQAGSYSLAKKVLSQISEAKVSEVLGQSLELLGKAGVEAGSKAIGYHAGLPSGAYAGDWLEQSMALKLLGIASQEQREKALPCMAAAGFVEAIELILDSGASGPVIGDALLKSSGAGPNAGKCSDLLAQACPIGLISSWKLGSCVELVACIRSANHNQLRRLLPLVDTGQDLSEAFLSAIKMRDGESQKLLFRTGRVDHLSSKALAACNWGDDQKYVFELLEKCKGAAALTSAMVDAARKMQIRQIKDTKLMQALFDLPSWECSPHRLWVGLNEAESTRQYLKGFDESSGAAHAVDQWLNESKFDPRMGKSDPMGLGMFLCSKLGRKALDAVLPMMDSQMLGWFLAAASEEQFEAGIQKALLQSAIDPWALSKGIQSAIGHARLGSLEAIMRHPDGLAAGALAIKEISYKDDSCEGVAKILSLAPPGAWDAFQQDLGQALCEAARSGSLAMFKALKGHVAKMPLTSRGETLLMKAIESGSLELVDFLLPLSDASAKASEGCWGGKTALDIARSTGGGEMISMLVAHQAQRPSAQASKGMAFP